MKSIAPLGMVVIAVGLIILLCAAELSWAQEGQANAVAADDAAAAEFFEYGRIFGLSVLIISIGLGFFMTAVAIKVLKSGVTAGSTEWHVGLIAASVALFGVLITGVFVFMSLQITSSARDVARLQGEVAGTSAGTSAANTAAPNIVAQAVEQAVKQAMADMLDREREAARGNFGNQLEYTRTRRSFDDATVVLPGNPQRIDFDYGESRRFRLDASAGSYRIDVVAVTEFFDPVVYLYRHGTVPASDPDAPIEALDSNDDVEPGNLNSRIDMQIEDGWTYYIEVSELVGEPGEATVTWQQVEQ